MFCSCRQTREGQTRPSTPKNRPLSDQEGTRSKSPPVYRICRWSRDSALGAIGQRHCRAARMHGDRPPDVCSSTARLLSGKTAPQPRDLVVRKGGDTEGAIDLRQGVGGLEAVERVSGGIMQRPTDRDSAKSPDVRSDLGRQAGWTYWRVADTNTGCPRLFDHCRSAPSNGMSSTSSRLS